MHEEETPDPLREIDKIAFTNADFLQQDLKDKRIQVLLDLKNAYSLAVIERNPNKAEKHFTNMLANWNIHQTENLDAPELFSDEEKETLTKYVDEIDNIINPKKD